MRSNQKQFLVLGIGRFGSSLAKNLYKLGHEVLAVDRDENLVDDIAPYVTQAVQADATDEAALEALGVRNYDAAIVATGNVRDSVQQHVLGLIRFCTAFSMLLTSPRQTGAAAAPSWCLHSPCP